MVKTHTNNTLRIATVQAIFKTIVAMRVYGYNRTSYTMLLRSVVGTIKKNLVFALPDSTNETRESMQAIFPSVFYVLVGLKGARHN